MQLGINPQDILALSIALLINLMITVMFCKSLIKALSFVASENITIKPGLIWLLLVPGVNYLMNFLIVFEISKSLSNELESRGFDEVKRPTFSSGIIFAALSLSGAITFFIPLPEKFAVIAGAIGFAQIFFFIQYWMKVNWYKTVLQNDEDEALGQETK